MHETFPGWKSWRRPSEKDRELTKVGLSVLKSEEMLVGGSNSFPRKLGIGHVLSGGLYYRHKV